MLKSTRAFLAQATRDWTHTLHLPKSTLPPRPDPATQSKYLKRCTDELYASQKRARPALLWKAKDDVGPTEHIVDIDSSKDHVQVDNAFVLHDGPPYANGSLHIGHAMNKILKDFILRAELKKGKQVDFVPGWDCHGLPIELKALQKQQEMKRFGTKAPGQTKREDSQYGTAATSAVADPIEIRTLARDLASQTIEEQKDGFKQWAVMGDWENSYQTMFQDFELRQLKVFREMVAKGLIYRQYRPVHWSPSSGTALAEAELEYDDHHRSTAAFVKFPLTTLPEVLLEDKMLTNNNLHAVIWTTTPWTLPANKAIAVHNDMEYCIISSLDPSNDAQLLIGAPLLENLLGHLPEHATYRVVKSGIKGSDLAGATFYRHPLDDIESTSQPIVHADFVTSQSGSGLVHMAPGHGMEDYEVCKQHSIECFAPVDDAGCFRASMLPQKLKCLDGKPVATEGSAIILDILSQHDALVASHEILHKYPTDWRTKQPVIVRATQQWFADVASIREDALRALTYVQFIGGGGQSRLAAFIQGRSEWCISRQRAWGVPIPALYRKTDDGLDAIMTPTSISHIMEVIQQRGTNAWWTNPPDDPAWIPADLPNGEYIRGADTMDVWFDSGTTWTNLKGSFNQSKRPPADVYLEGTDQHRGWFQSSLLTYVSKHKGAGDIGPVAPFKTLITHGFTLDREGRKMSKSIGNVISPDAIIDGSMIPDTKRKKKGNGTSVVKSADRLRMLVAMSDYTKDVTIHEDVVRSANDMLNKWRITLKWLLGIMQEYGTLHFSAKRTFSEAFKLRAHPVDAGAFLRQASFLDPIDRLVFYQLNKTRSNVHDALSHYHFAQAQSYLTNFVNNDLSAFYFEILKDRIYCGGAQTREDNFLIARTIFLNLIDMMDWVTPLLTTEAWAHFKAIHWGSIQQYAPGLWPPPLFERDEVMEKNLQAVKVVREAIQKAQERARNDGLIRSGLESQAKIVLDQTDQENLKLLSPDNAPFLANAFLVSSLSIGEGSNSPSRLPSRHEECFTSGHLRGVAIVERADAHKCPRCWQWTAPRENTLCQRCETVVAEQEALSKAKSETVNAPVQTTSTEALDWDWDWDWDWKFTSDETHTSH